MTPAGDRKMPVPMMPLMVNSTIDQKPNLLETFRGLAWAGGMDAMRQYGGLRPVVGPRHHRVRRSRDQARARATTIADVAAQACGRQAAGYGAGGKISSELTPE